MTKTGDDAHLTKRVVAFAAIAWMAACGPANAVPDGRATDAAYDWNLPANFPTPRVPADNAMTAEKVALGRQLFYEVRLSANETTSCASCHAQSHAFTDSRARAVGATGDVHRRNAMSLTNVAYNPAFTWTGSTITQLEQHVRIPMLGTSPIELGFGNREAEIIGWLRDDQRYAAMFRAAFPGESNPTTTTTIAKSLASFVRTLISSNAAYDRWLRGDTTALSLSAQRGYDLFFGDRLECYQCHTGFNLSAAVVDTQPGGDELRFQNTGLYDIGARGEYPAADQGLIESTRQASDMGRFRAPTLRNIELTGPYMHDGSIPSLEEVLAHYAAGGRTIATGPNAGDGSANPLKDPAIHGFALTDRERDDVLAFLRSLTDWEFVHSPRLSNPFMPPLTDTAADCHDAVTVTCPIHAPSYRESIASIIEARCGGCHHAGGPGSAWPLTTHADISLQRAAIRAQLIGCRMPPAEAASLDERQRIDLIAWLDCNAPDN